MDETPIFDSSVTCEICGTGIPAVKIDFRIIARYTCANSRNDVLIEGDKT